MLSKFNIIRKSAKILIVLLSLSCLFALPSKAAIFTFTGNVDFQTVNNAELFGVNNGTSNGTFIATLDFDDTLLPEDGHNVGSSPETQKSITYIYNNFLWNVGTTSWSHTPNPDPGRASVTVSLDQGTGQDNDLLHISGSNVQSVGDIENLNVQFSKSDIGGINSTHASSINLFNSLTPRRNSNFIGFRNRGQNFQLQLSNINMTISDISAVPLPAGVWLFGTAMLGFIGLKHRKNT